MHQPLQTYVTTVILMPSSIIIVLNSMLLPYNSLSPTTTDRRYIRYIHVQLGIYSSELIFF